MCATRITVMIVNDDDSVYLSVGLVISFGEVKKRRKDMWGW